MILLVKNKINKNFIQFKYTKYFKHIIYNFENI